MATAGKHTHATNPIPTLMPRADTHAAAASRAHRLRKLCWLIFDVSQERICHVDSTGRGQFARVQHHSAVQTPDRGQDATAAKMSASSA